MSVRCSIIEEPSSRLTEHKEIPIHFEVRTVFDIEGDDPGTTVLTETPVEKPWIKDYDTIGNVLPENGVLLAAYVNDRRVGGSLLIDQVDSLVIWDFRVHPDHRRTGIGRQLFHAAATWATDRNYKQLTVETQNINVPACRFYQRVGCRLISIDRNAYAELPEEVQLIWGVEL